MGKIGTYAHYFQDYIKHGDFTSILNSINYIVLGKVNSKDRVVKTSTGQFYCRAGSIDFQFANERYEIKIKEVVKEKIEEGYQLFFDIGACIGEHSIHAAKLGAKVYAFEPVSQNYQILQKNITLNQLNHKISALNFGLGEREYLAFFEYNPVNTGMSKRIDEQSDITAEIKPFNKVYDELEIDHSIPVILKIDVEGMEADVLEGALNTFAQLDKLFIIFEDKHSKLSSIIQQLDSIGNFQYNRIDKYNMSALKLK